MTEGPGRFSYSSRYKGPDTPPSRYKYSQKFVERQQSTPDDDPYGPPEPLTFWEKARAKMAGILDPAMEAAGEFGQSVTDMVLPGPSEQDQLMASKMPMATDAGLGAGVADANLAPPPDRALMEAELGQAQGMPLTQKPSLVQHPGQVDPNWFQNPALLQQSVVSSPDGSIGPVTEHEQAASQLDAAIWQQWEDSPTLKKIMRAGYTGIHNAPGVIGLTGRTLIPETEQERLIEEGKVDLSKGETAMMMLGTMAPAVAEVLLVKAGARALGAAYAAESPQTAKFLNEVGRIRAGVAGRMGGAKTGLLEGLTVDVTQYLEDNNEAWLGTGLGLGATIGFLFPGGATLAEEAVEAIRKDPETAAEAIGTIVTEGLKKGNAKPVNELIEMAVKHEDEQVREVATAVVQRLNEMAEESVEGVGRQVAFQMEDGTVVPVEGAKGHADGVAKLTDEQLDNVAARGFIEDGEFKPGSGTVDSPKWTEPEQVKPAPEQVKKTETPPEAPEAPRTVEADVEGSGRREVPDRRQATIPVAKERRSTFRRARDIARRARETAPDEKTGVQGANAFEKARAAIDADPEREWVTIDITNFKAINDQQSYEAGDYVLRELADGLKGILPARSIFRRGGDEFAVAVPKGMGEEVQRVMDEVFYPRNLGDLEIKARTGLGDTVEQADEAMAGAKKAETGPRYRDTAPKPEAEAPKAEPEVERAKTPPHEEIETGKPYKFTYARNPEKAPQLGSRFQQDIEPAGRYVTDTEGQPPPPGWEGGEIEFQNPLVLRWGGDYDETSWKAQLSEMYGGLTGRKLTNAVKKDGFDGIVTVTDRGTSEIVDLRGPAKRAGAKKAAAEAPAPKRAKDMTADELKEAAQKADEGVRATQEKFGTAKPKRIPEGDEVIVMVDGEPHRAKVVSNKTHGKQYTVEILDEGRLQGKSVTNLDHDQLQPVPKKPQLPEGVKPKKGRAKKAKPRDAQTDLFRMGIGAGLTYGAFTSKSDDEKVQVLQAGMGAIGMALLGGIAFSKTPEGVYKGKGSKARPLRAITREEARMWDDLPAPVKYRAALEGFDDPEAYGATLIWKGMNRQEWETAIHRQFGADYEIDFDKLYDKSMKFFENRVNEAFDSELGLATFKEVEEAVKKGIEIGGHKWYDDVYPVLESLLGKEHAERFSKLLAATSPQSDAYTANITFAKQSLLEYLLLGEVKSVRLMPQEMVQSAAEGSLIIGNRKVSSYGWALGGNLEVVVNDVWMHRLFGFGHWDLDAAKTNIGLTNKVTDSQYRFIEQTVRQLAEEHNLKPAQIQAAAWLGAKEIWENPEAPMTIFFKPGTQRIVPRAARQLENFGIKPGDLMFQGKKIASTPDYGPALREYLEQDPAFIEVVRGSRDLETIERTLMNTYKEEDAIRMIAAVRKTVVEKTMKAQKAAGLSDAAAMTNLVEVGTKQAALPAMLGLAVPMTPGEGDKSDKFMAAIALGIGLGVGGPAAYKYINAASGGKLAAYLTPGGALKARVKQFGNEEAAHQVARGITAMHGEIAKAQRIMKQVNADVAAWAKKQGYGSRGRVGAVLGNANPWEYVPDNIVKAVNDYLYGKVTFPLRKPSAKPMGVTRKDLLNRIPEDLRPMVRRMRVTMDLMSRTMVREGIVEGELAAKFTRQMGAYLTRSYSVFDIPNWAEAAPRILGEQKWAQIQNRFRAWYRREFDPQGVLSPEQVENAMEDFLSVGVEGNVLKALGTGRMGKLNSNILKRRGSLPEEVRALWGEHSDPGVNFMRTLENQAHYIGTYKFLTAVREAGLGSGFLFEEVKSGGKYLPTSPVRPKGMTAEIAGPGTEAMRPLAGLRTYPEIKEALINEFKHRATDNPVISAFLLAGTASKLAKTVGSQVTQIRNLTGNSGFASLQGYIAEIPSVLKGFRNGFQGIRHGAGLGTDQSWRTFYNRLAELGVVDDGARAEEVAAALKTLNEKGAGQWFRKFSNVPIVGRVLNGVQMFGKGSLELYRAEDDIWKVIAFTVERKRYAKAMPNLNAKQLDEKAASIVRRTWPTFSEVPVAIQDLRRVGGFLSFPAEVYRSVYGTLDLIEEEWKNPATRSIAAKRIAGAVMTFSAGAVGASAASKAYHNLTDDEEWAIRQYQPPWSRNAVLVYLDRPEDGKFRVFDSSYTDPFSYLHAPLVAFMKGEDWRQTTLDVVQALYEPFFTVSPFVSELREEIEAGEEEGWKMLLNAAIKGATPGVIDQWTRALTGKTAPPSMRSVDKEGELRALFTGAKAMTTDVRISLYHEALRFKEGVSRGAVSEYERSTERGYSTRIPDKWAEYNPFATSMREAKEDAREQMEDAYDRMYRFVEAAGILGLSKKEISQILTRARLNNTDKAALLDVVP